MGLLGPNGAGKTSLMRILTCYHFPDGGRAAVGGHDVAGQPHEVRRSVGYLPEGSPQLGHTRADLYRCLLEAVGYSIRHNLEALEAQGCRARRILAVGGGTRNPDWLRMVSDIAGIAQDIPEQQIGASYGDAFLAGVGVGMFRGLSEVRRWVRYREALRPDASVRAVYDGLYRIYRELYRRNRDLMRELGELAR